MPPLDRNTFFYQTYTDTAAAWCELWLNNNIKWPRCEGDVDVSSSSGFIPGKRTNIIQNALPGLSYLVRWKTKTSEVNLIHIFVWNPICSRYLTLVHWFCLSDSPIGGKLDVFHWLSSCKEKSISEHPAAAGPLLTYQMGHWRRNWPHLFLMSP